MMPVVIEKIQPVNEIKPVLHNNPENSFFTSNELLQCSEKNKIKSLGARYMIKKSIIDFLEISDDYASIEIINNASGKPEAILSDKLKQTINKKKLTNLKISISHSKNYIATLVIFE
ncbi:MAG: hypothetical protein RBT49_09050 [Bacteroidales bacterium]|jgi:holo-[acyl-carrier protein] synthase|nr:hypothetical protein [Bacteroidales bacterium]